MLSKLRKMFPGAYEYYLHLKRRKTNKRIKALKQMSPERYPALLAELYEKRVGTPLDWSNIKAYTEKMQWENTKKAKLLINNKGILDLSCGSSITEPSQ